MEFRAMVTQIRVDELHAHPDNPRLASRQDVIDQMAAGMADGFPAPYALMVRRNGRGYQILAGHHRHAAAVKAGLAEVPCWVVERDDAEAFMELVRSNAQGELTPLERGMHALKSGMHVKAYARIVGRARQSVSDEVCAARVAATVPDIRHEDLNRRCAALAPLHGTPSWLWPALAEACVAKSWTVADARGRAAALKGMPPPPAWADAEAVARGLADSSFSPQDVRSMEPAVAGAAIHDADIKADLLAELEAKRPDSLAAVRRIVAFQVERQAKRSARGSSSGEPPSGGLFGGESASAPSTPPADRARLLHAVSLEKWKTLGEAIKADLLGGHGETGRSFNKQDNAEIEWAQWSWNPVTGCLHDCPYCYARDIALGPRMAEAYPNGFAPTLKPRTLLAPRGKRPPELAATDTRYRNVFTCSMADLFGRWVPQEWIEAVLGEIRDAPAWNFLCLTKFPKRMAEFDLPPNAWMGTTVDLQARVPAAEAAFAKIKSGVRWLSIEPLLEPLRFKRLDLFDWIVVGGASASLQTPEWRPPHRWIVDIRRQAEEAGVPVYEKTNLYGNRTLELPFQAPVRGGAQEAPAVFRYLGKSGAKMPEAA
jgi:protein gp37/ParB-like chromosome segregation protein Spo0J